MKTFYALSLYQTAEWQPNLQRDFGDSATAGAALQAAQRGFSAPAVHTTFKKCSVKIFHIFNLLYLDFVLQTGKNKVVNEGERK